MKKLQDLIQFEQFDHLELLAKQIVEGFLIGLHRSPYCGFSVEFAEHRQYRKGEPTKHVDWKLFARSDKMFVKQFEEETNLRTHIVVDTSSSMLFPFYQQHQTKLSYSILCSAAFIHLLRKQRDAVGLCCFSNKIDLLTPAKLSFTHTQLLYAHLQRIFTNNTIKLNQKTKISNTLHQLAENLHKRSLLLIFSDFISNESTLEIMEALHHLRFKKHEVMLFAVRDHELEVDFDFENRPYRFVDLESGDSLKLNPSEIKNLYQKEQQDFFSELHLKCTQFSIDLIEADIRTEFSKLLQTYLLKRKKLK